MRADIHDGPEHKRSKQRPDTLMQDRVCRIDENLLHRTAGPYIRVKLRRTLSEQMSSGLPLKADAMQQACLKRATSGCSTIWVKPPKYRNADACKQGDDLQADC